MKKKSAALPGVKAYDKDLKCRGHQFEVGNTYTHAGEVKICESGYHFCENPFDVLNYYNVCDCRFTEVTATGVIVKHNEDTKIAAASITVGAELHLPQFISKAIEWVSKSCKADDPASGDSSQLAASGDSSQLAASGYSSQLAASGDSSQLAASGYSSKLAASGYSSKLAASGHSSKLAASGHYSQLAASGDSSKLAASGDSSQLAASGYSSKLAASGDSSQLAASGDSSVAVCSGVNSKIKTGKNGAMALSRWVTSENRYRITVAYEGENGIKADTWYGLDKDGNFQEVP